MANTRELQSRMKSIKDTMKITSAMHMIASSNLQKAKKNLEDRAVFLYIANHDCRYSWTYAGWDRTSVF